MSFKSGGDFFHNAADKQSNKQLMAKLPDFWQIQLHEFSDCDKYVRGYKPLPCCAGR